MNITTKGEMYRLFESGEFGNKTRSWRFFEEYRESDFDRPVALRSVGVPGGPCVYNLSREKAEEEYKRWIDRGIPTHQIQVSEMLRGQYIRIAGEVVQSEQFYDLFFYRKPGVHMRDGLKRYGGKAFGLRAHTFLRHYMDDRSWDNLCRLFDEYPQHVIEFTCCSVPVGELGWNTIFWEVRYY